MTVAVTDESIRRGALPDPAAVETLRAVRDAGGLVAVLFISDRVDPWTWLHEHAFPVDAAAIGALARFRVDYDVLVDHDPSGVAEAEGFDAVGLLAASDGTTGSLSRWPVLSWAELGELLVPLAAEVLGVDVLRRWETVMDRCSGNPALRSN